MSLTINELIEVHRRAGFKRGHAMLKFHFTVWIEANDNMLLVVNAAPETVVVYKFNSTGKFLDYGSETIDKQAWARTLCPNADYRNAGEVWLDRQDRARECVPKRIP